MQANSLHHNYPNFIWPFKSETAEREKNTKNK